jgi:hypothetical protein
MLYQVGPLQFTALGMNTHKTNRTTTANFAEKDVIGVLKPAEFFDGVTPGAGAE